MKAKRFLLCLCERSEGEKYSASKQSSILHWAKIRMKRRKMMYAKNVDKNRRAEYEESYREWLELLKLTLRDKGTRKVCVKLR